MSKEFLENGVAKIDLESGARPIPDAVSAKLAIEQLSEETHELSGEQSEAIIGGISRLELSDEQLESIAVGLERAGIRVVIGF